MNADIRIDDEAGGYHARWSSTQGEFKMARTSDLGGCLVEFLRDRKGVFDVLIVLRPVKEGGQ